jgi:hypothetical protein
MARTDALYSLIHKIPSQQISHFLPVWSDYLTVLIRFVMHKAIILKRKSDVEYNVLIYIP